MSTNILNEEWEVNESYEWYDDFYDDDISIIDEKKNIILNENQINITQEELSQFIPFEMNRKQDNFDVAIKSKIQFHFVNSENEEDYVDAVNVKYNDEKLRFGLLVPATMTAKAGKVKFEVIATGKNSKGGTYRWISKTNEQINIEKSLSGSNVISPESYNWYNDLVQNIENKITDLETSTYDFILEEVKHILVDYYTKQETENLINNINISEENLTTLLNNIIKDDL